MKYVLLLLAVTALTMTGCSSDNDMDHHNMNNGMNNGMNNMTNGQSRTMTVPQ